MIILNNYKEKYDTVKTIIQWVLISVQFNLVILLYYQRHYMPTSKECDLIMFFQLNKCMGLHFKTRPLYMYSTNCTLSANIMIQNGFPDTSATNSNYWQRFFSVWPAVLLGLLTSQVISTSLLWYSDFLFVDNGLNLL